MHKMRSKNLACTMQWSYWLSAIEPLGSMKTLRTSKFDFLPKNHIFMSTCLKKHGKKHQKLPHFQMKSGN